MSGAVPTSAAVVVIGGGHAGVEAAWAAASALGCAHDATPGVVLVTIDPTKIGVMSCNPAIGGLAKGQLVREIDALGGVMSLVTDATGIQFKVLNTSKGPAVHGPRAQCDKHAYAEAVQMLIASRPGIAVVAGEVERLEVESGRLRAVWVKPRAVGAAVAGEHAHGADDAPIVRAAVPTEPVRIECGAAVLTTGTFMRGLMHTGEAQREGGRFGEAAAVGISGMLRELGFELGRLKTGTPPRLARGSIDWLALREQRGDEPPTPFADVHGDAGWRIEKWSAGEDARFGVAGREESRRRLGRWREAGFVLRGGMFPLLPQVDCRESQTGPEAHAAIRANLHRAPMYSGQIESVGPRYCPSIEDKVVRFAERESHTVFLEPESLRDDWVYANGISTSLPADVQDAIVRSLPGCARAEILRYGYAVEYDMVRPHQIYATGMTKRVAGLFLAGQINGTSGYEEAGAQGLIAGLNAARFVGGLGEVVLGREDAYAGVLMDDLVTKTPVEPYRMFTSRAEHRMMLRSDNAAERLSGRAAEWGLLREDDPIQGARVRAWRERTRLMAELDAIAASAKFQGKPIREWLRMPEFDEPHFVHATRSAGTPRDYPSAVWRAVFAERMYEPYVERQRAEIRRHAELEHRRIPAEIDYGVLDGLRAEARAALARFRPATFGQAGRLEGVTPADVMLLAVHVRRAREGGRA
jgi:tRNA uridine 5-carboxymethylaminomethyl modification enzyme